MNGRVKNGFLFLTFVTIPQIKLRKSISGIITPGLDYNSNG